MQCFTSVTASVPRFTLGGIGSAEEAAFAVGWVIAAFSPILILYLARRAGFFLGLLAVAIIPIFMARVLYLTLSQVWTPRHAQVDWSMWANDFLGLFSVFILLVLGAAYVIALAIEWILVSGSWRDARKK